jgi:hypothetical protein
MLLTVPALLAIWWLAVRRAPRWAWAGAVLAGLGVIGQVVHLTGYYFLNQVLARRPALTAAAEMLVAIDQHPFMVVLFVPFLLGLLAVLPQAVGLRRARAVPLWAAFALIGGTAVMLVTGSTPWTSALHTGLLLAGFAPAAIRILRGEAMEERRGIAEPALA